jgi:hypothetical protein
MLYLFLLREPKINRTWGINLKKALCVTLRLGLALEFVLATFSPSISNNLERWTIVQVSESHQTDCYI